MAGSTLEADPRQGLDAEDLSAGVADQRQALLAWFNRHKRDLPWRRTRDPYAIWVSEIMLQQTRVAAVLDHYGRWMARFSTVEALAAAEEPEVLAMWSGLGYYRRARYLHAGARAVVAEHAGTIPGTAATLRALPGIGDYTAAAVASIAFGEPVAVVDGNVERVVMRLGGLTEATPGLAGRIRAAAGGLLVVDRAGDWNQAMMELGATLCLPRAPLCLQCPVQPWCRTRGEHQTLPRKAMQRRTVTYGLAQREGRAGTEVLLTQRSAEASLMASMWELPEVAASSALVRDSQDPAGAAVPLLTVKHAITVTQYSVYIVAVAEDAFDGRLPTHWLPVCELPATALTGLARKVLKRLALWPPF